MPRRSGKKQRLGIVSLMQEHDGARSVCRRCMSQWRVAGRVIGYWAGREHDVSVPDGCYGLPTLFGSNHLPATLTNLTIFHNSKTTRGLQQTEKSHSTLPTL